MVIIGSGLACLCCDVGQFLSNVWALIGFFCMYIVAVMGVGIKMTLIYILGSAAWRALII